MRLSELLQNWVTVDASQDGWVTDITQDSRRLTAGALFVACPGLRVDGRHFIPQALVQGVSAIIYECADGYQLPAIGSTTIPVLGIPNLNQQIGLIAAKFYQNPTEQMTIIGVTGTNGKTSISQFVAQALTVQQRRCAVIGTLGKGFLPHLQATGYTTPDAISLQRDLAEYHRQGADSVAMEVSSHSLHQDRVAGIQFDIAVFTNLTQDHLDYHHTMAEYGAAKAKLFQYPSLRQAIYNADDPFGLELLNQCPATVEPLIYTTQAQKQSVYPAVIAEKIEPALQGFTIQVRTPWGKGSCQTRLLGRFNISNLLAALGVLGSLKIPLAESLLAISQLQPVAGRMEVYGGRNGKPQVIVDYAHTPDALKQALTALREHQPHRLWCVFGCGGDRDRGKRAQMGAIAEQYSDAVIITNDNPRSERPEQIAAEISAGLQNSARAYVELDREAAIAAALQMANPTDIILVAGKGHETEQIIGDQVLPFSDRAVIQRLLGQ